MISHWLNPSWKFKAVNVFDPVTKCLSRQIDKLGSVVSVQDWTGSNCASSLDELLAPGVDATGITCVLVLCAEGIGTQFNIFPGAQF